MPLIVSGMGPRLREGDGFQFCGEMKRGLVLA
jgi:hypothetical protein